MLDLCTPERCRCVADLSVETATPDTRVEPVEISDYGLQLLIEAVNSVGVDRQNDHQMDVRHGLNRLAVSAESWDGFLKERPRPIGRRKGHLTLLSN